MRLVTAALGAMAMLAASPASASEIFGGILKHDVKTSLTASGNVEDGLDFQLGWRGGRIGPTPLQPYLYGSLNSAGDTSFVAAGISARFGGSVYVRPGLGFALHNGSAGNFYREDRIAFGSRLLFAPEIGVGVQLSPRVSAEATLVHLSHGQLFGKQNPGMDSVGIRVNVALP